jgi:hypothetical protein
VARVWLEQQFFFFLEFARATVIKQQLICRIQESFLDFPMKKDLDFSF